MSSSICQHFTQNAWKKDLCSNCFKSKDEHKQQTSYSSTFKLPAQFTSNAKLNSGNSRSENERTKKTDYPNKNKRPAKGIIKKSMLATSKSTSAKSKSHKVSFPKNVYEIIGYGGDWSDNDSNDEEYDFMNSDANERDENAATSTDDEETLEMKRITRANTDFNMNNGNLLGDPEENIKKSFAALKLGAPQVDKEGKKQTLKISVVPFGVAAGTEIAKQASIAATTVKAKFETKAELVTTTTTTTTTKQSATLKSVKKVGGTTTTEASVTKSTTAKSSATAAKSDASFTSDNDGKSSPPIMRAMEKSLLDEISETLEQKQNESKKLAAEASQNISSSTPGGKIKFEITSLSDTLESKQTFLELKKPIARNAPITKEHSKPRVNVFHKYSDSDSNCSDAENGVSAYYDVVETQVSYENLPDGKFSPLDKSSITGCSTSAEDQDQSDNKSVYSSSQYITDMLLSSKTRAASYNLHEGNFMTSKITSDGLIVTKCSSDDALDSTGSSFDGSSDEETSYNMIRCESDSGIGISIGSEYKNVPLEKDSERQRVQSKLSGSTNNSDYEDIQVVEQVGKTNQTQGGVKPTAFSLEKRRELHGEPDGSADPDGSLENKEPTAQQLPALPKSPPPTKIIDARTSFLHGLQKGQTPILTKKPELPAKPVVAAINSPLKNFIGKRKTNSPEQQVINQLQLVMSRSSENLVAEAVKDADAKLRKGRAPGPPPEHKSSAPPTPERDYNISIQFETHTPNANNDGGELATRDQPSVHTSGQVDKGATGTGSKSEAVETITTKLTTSTITATAPNSSSLYTRKLPAATTIANGSGASKANSSPVIREKDKRERATVNPKFRSLNTFATQRNNVAKQLQFQGGSSPHGLKQTMTPEPTPRNHKNLSMSQECLPSALPTSSSTISASSLNLTTTPSGDKKSSSTPPQKTKTKFSIKKFLRMGTSSKSSGDSLHHKSKDHIYSEICTGEETGVAGKPRLVIIHPIDINPTAVEVVKDITQTSDAVTAQTVAMVTPAKPPPPPMRALDKQRVSEMNKPARPPPPQSAELRRKQQQQGGESGIMAVATIAEDPGANAKCSKATDNVYANLGEIRLSIAPRKPERTASMREREAQLELARKRHMGGGGGVGGGGRSNENTDTISICSSNADNVSSMEQHSSTSVTGSENNNASKKEKVTNPTQNLHLTVVDGSGSGKPPIGSRTSTFERTKKEPKAGIVSKLEIFENRNSNNSNSSGGNKSTSTEGRPSSLKDSVRKINSTIDSYLKDKRDYENMYDFVKAASTPPPPPARSSVDLIGGGQRQQQASRRNNLYSSDTNSIASYTRSEYGPGRHYGLNNSLANIPRVISASYCGSEMSEFDIYAPYSYYGSEAGGDVAGDINDSVWGVPSAIKNRRTKATNRLRMRKGRSVVHKTIEDNYTAVVVANHEALAQVLDQLQQTPVIPSALRPLANAINLRFEDFSMIEGSQAFVVGKKAFHAALWSMAPVTLALSADSNQLSGVGGELSQLSGGVSGVLNPITEFCDLVPSYHLPLMPSTEMVMLQATISVLPRLQLETLQSIGGILKGKSQVLDKSNFNFRGSIPNLSAECVKDSLNALRNVVSVQNLSTLNEESSTASLDNANSPTAEEAPPTAAAGMPAYDDVMTREVAFIMLQLVNGMKNLQVKAIEEMPLSLSNVVLSKDVDNKDAQARLCVLHGNNNDEDEPMGTLCKCAHIALTEMLPLTKITPILADILGQERAESLSRAKSVLEFVLWGPSDVVLSGATKERELALQRWLDLERATVLHGLVRTRIELTVYDECHLMFLVRSNAKMMNDAAKIVCSFQQQQQQQQQITPTEVAQKD